MAVGIAIKTATEFIPIGNCFAMDIYYINFYYMVFII